MSGAPDLQSKILALLYQFLTLVDQLVGRILHQFPAALAGERFLSAEELLCGTQERETEQHSSCWEPRSARRQHC